MAHKRIYKRPQEKWWCVKLNIVGLVDKKETTQVVKAEDSYYAMFFAERMVNAKIDKYGGCGKAEAYDCDEATESDFANYKEQKIFE